MKSNLQGKRFATFALLLVAMIWGLGFIATDVLIKEQWTTSQMMAVRFTLASVIMLLVLGKRILLTNRRDIINGSIAGVVLFAAFYSQTFGQSIGASVSYSAFLTATNVVMVPFISWIINSHKPTVKTNLIALLALAGVGVLSIKNGYCSLSLGDLIILLCAFLFALHIAYLEKAGKGTNALRVNFYQITTAALLAIIVLTYKGGCLPVFTISKGMLAAFYLGALSTCACYLLQTKAQQYVSANYAGVILALEGFFGSLFSVALSLEKLTINLVIGGAMIVVATALMSVKSSHEDEIV